MVGYSWRLFIIAVLYGLGGLLVGLCGVVWWYRVVLYVRVFKMRCTSPSEKRIGDRFIKNALIILKAFRQSIPIPVTRGGVVCYDVQLGGIH